MFRVLLTSAIVAATILVAPVRADAQPTMGLTLDEIRSAITASGEFVIIDDAAFGDEQLIFVNFNKKLILGFVVSCPASSAPKCTGVHFYTPYPASMKADAFFTNRLNQKSKIGWISASADGQLAAHHGLVLIDVSPEELVFNLRIFGALYVVRGQQILETNTGELTGVSLSAAERKVDLDHLPAATIGSFADVEAMFASFDGENDLAEVLSDAQLYGAFRKIANDFLGE